MDKFEDIRKHLHEYSDEDLKKYFWELTEKIVDPLIDLAKKHTTPSIERSVLLRMGFNSLQCQDLVKKGMQYGFMSKGIGNVVYRYAKRYELSILAAGEQLLDDKSWENVHDLFE